MLKMEKLLNLKNRNSTSYVRYSFNCSGTNMSKWTSGFSSVKIRSARNGESERFSPVFKRKVNILPWIKRLNGCEWLSEHYSPRIVALLGIVE